MPKYLFLLPNCYKYLYIYVLIIYEYYSYIVCLVCIIITIDAYFLDCKWSEIAIDFHIMFLNYQYLFKFVLRNTFNSQSITSIRYFFNNLF